MGQNLNFRAFLPGAKPILCPFGTEVIWETLVPDHKRVMSHSDNDIPSPATEESDSDPEGIELEKYVRNEIYTVLKEEGLLNRDREASKLTSRAVRQRRGEASAVDSTSVVHLPHSSASFQEHKDGHRNENSRTVAPRQAPRAKQCKIRLQEPTSTVLHVRKQMAKMAEVLPSSVQNVEQNATPSVRKEEAMELETSVQPSSFESTR